MSISIEKLPAALCDAVSAGFFLVVWLSPMVLGPEAVRTAFMLVLVEFLLLHAAGVLSQYKAEARVGCLPLIGFGGGYLLFFMVAAVSYETIWPLFALAWMLTGKLFSGGTMGHRDIGQQHWNNGIWMLSFMAWLGLVVLIALLPIPRLGMQPEIMAQVDAFAVSGALVDRPHKLMAFGTAYFMLLATAKLTRFNMLDCLTDRDIDQ